MPGVLDTFYILFKSDAEDVIKGAAKADDAVGKLDKRLTGADKAAVSMGTNFNKLATQAVAAFGSVFAVTQLISQAKGFAVQSTGLSTLSEVIGDSATEILSYGRAVENAGGNTEAFQSTLAGMRKGLTDFSIGGFNDFTRALDLIGGIKPFDEFGEIRTPLSLLPEIAKGFEGKTKSQILALSDMMGLDKGTMLLLSQGEEGVRALVDRQRELLGVTNEDIEALRMLNVMIQELGNSFDDSAKSILVSMLPAMTKLANDGFKAISNWINENQDIVETFFRGATLLAIGFAAPLLVAAFNFIVMAVAIGAAVYALGLLWDAWDYMAEGDDSPISIFLSGMINKLEQVRDLFLAIRDLLPSTWTDNDDPILSSLGLEPGSVGAKMRGMLGAGQESLALAGGAPIQALSAANAAQHFKNNFSRNSSLSVKEIIVNTQATDTKGIVADFWSEVQKQYQEAIDNSDDGVSA